MKIPSKLLPLAALLFILSWSGTSLGQVRSQTISCSSINNGKNRCTLPHRNVTIRRQISSSPCIRGRTWGWDNRSIWVDHGCRGEFTVDGNRWDRTGHWVGPVQTITCSSNNNRRDSCDLPPRNVTLRRQIGGPACIQGQTWGFDDQSIWVDGGCRAEFLLR